MVGSWGCCCQLGYFVKFTSQVLLLLISQAISLLGFTNLSLLFLVSFDFQTATVVIIVFSMVHSRRSKFQSCIVIRIFIVTIGPFFSREILFAPMPGVDGDQEDATELGFLENQEACRIAERRSIAGASFLRDRKP